MVAGMAAVNGKLYVTGGYNRENSSALTTGEVLDLATMQWESLPEMTTQRYEHGKCKATAMMEGNGRLC